MIKLIWDVIGNVTAHRKPSAKVTIVGVIINLYLYSFVIIYLYLRLVAPKESPKGTEESDLRKASWPPR